MDVEAAPSTFDTAEINIQVNSIPIIDAGVNQNICNGDTAQINVVGAVDYQWSPNINISAGNSSTINAWPVDTTTYIVTGIDTNFCINKDTIDINVWNLPVADAGEDASKGLKNLTEMITKYFPIIIGGVVILSILK